MSKTILSAGRAIVPAILLAGLLAGLMLLITPARGATTWYVSPTGSALNAGTSGSRWSIDHALSGGAGGSQVLPGDTILLETGAYTRTVTQGPVIANLNGASGSRITVKPETQNGRVTIRSSDATYGAAPILQLNGKFYDVFDIELTSVDGCDRDAVDPFGSDQTCSGGMTIYGDDIRTWRMVSHDSGQNNFYDGNQPVPSGGNGGPKNVEHIGDISYYQGFVAPDRVHSMGFYQKNPPDSLGVTTWRHLRYCMAFDGAGHAMQFNGGDGTVQQIRKIRVTGGAYWNAGRLYTLDGDSEWTVAQASNPPPQEVEELIYESVWFYEQDGTLRSAASVGTQDNTAKEFKFLNNKLFMGCTAFEEYYFEGLEITGNTVENRGGTNCNPPYGSSLVLFDKRWRNDTDGDGTPAPGLARTWNSNTYYAPDTTSAWFGRWIPNATFTFTNWKSSTGFDAASTLTAGAAPTQHKVERLTASDGTAYPGPRCNLVVYKSDAATSATVDIDGCGFSVGQGYEVWDVNNYYGTAVASGTYTGADISVPLTTFTKAAMHSAGSGFATPPHVGNVTGSDFFAFDIRGAAPAGTPTPTPTNTLTPTNTPTNTHTFTPTNTFTNQPTSTNTPTPTVTPTPFAGQKEYIFIEAEAGALTAPMVATADGTACNSQYVASNTVDAGLALYTFNVPVAGNYYVWVAQKSPDANTNSFYVSINGAADTTRIFDCGPTPGCDSGTGSSWVWIRMNDRSVGQCAVPTITLSTGSNTLRFRGREPNTLLDRLLITNDPAYTPGSCVGVTPTPAVTPADVHIDTICGKVIRRSHSHSGRSHKHPCPTPAQ